MRFDTLLHILRPGSLWVIEDPTLERYEDIQWLDKNASLPTYEEFEKEYQFETLRNIRNRFLRDSDKYVIPDWPHPNNDVKQAWIDYRQGLRDLPSNTTDPDNAPWPIIPCPQNIERLRLIEERKLKEAAEIQTQISVSTDTLDEPMDVELLTPPPE